MKHKGILLIHGLSGSPHEFVPVSDTLRRSGYQSHVVTLPGHGDQPDRLFHETSAIEILDHCAAEVERFSKEVDELYIIGHSLGGICTLLTAATMPNKLKGVVVFSAPYEHAYFYNYVHGLARLPLSQLVRGIYYAPRDNIKAKRPDCMPWNVPRLLKQSQIIFNLMKENVHQIEVPVSLAHSLYDLTIPYTEMDKLVARIGKPELIKTTTLMRSGHRIFPVSQDMDEAMRLVFDFLETDCHLLDRRYHQQAASSIILAS